MSCPLGTTYSHTWCQRVNKKNFPDIMKKLSTIKFNKNLSKTDTKKEKTSPIYSQLLSTIIKFTLWHTTKKLNNSILNFLKVFAASTGFAAKVIQNC